MIQCANNLLYYSPRIDAVPRPIGRRRRRRSRPTKLHRGNPEKLDEHEWDEIPD
jgi:hypothetical protein